MLYVQKSAISSGRLTLLISTLHYTGEEFKDVIKNGEHPVAGRCAYQTGTNKKGGSAKGTAILFLYKKLVQSLCQLSTSLELSNLLGSNLDFLAACRVDTLTSRTLVNAKCSKTNKSNLVTCNECILNSGYSCVECFLGICL